MNAVEFEEEYVYQGRSYTIWSDVEYEVEGGFLSETEVDPAEYPIVVLRAVKVGGVEHSSDPKSSLCLILKEAISGHYIDKFDFHRDDLRGKIYDRLQGGG